MYAQVEPWRQLRPGMSVSIISGALAGGTGTVMVSPPQAILRSQSILSVRIDRVIRPHQEYMLRSTRSMFAHRLVPLTPSTHEVW